MIVLGGGLVAAADVVLRKTGVDVCCTGEGEKTMFDLVAQYAEFGINKDHFAHIPGLAWLDEGTIKMTRLADQLSDHEIFDIDWSILDETNTRDVRFRSDAEALSSFAHDPRFYEPERRGKFHGKFFSSKGCVARCTFCHRFGKGIRYIPMDLLKSRLTHFIQRYNIGFLSWNDENFGVHDRWLEPFCAMMKEFNVLWNVGGIRVGQVTPKKLAMMHDAGCVRVSYGMETGSERMLKVMEKKVELEDNYNAARWTTEAGIAHGIQLVIGMPGETATTVRETIKFAQQSLAIDPWLSPFDLGINHAQALPGTPLYEFARNHSLIGSSTDAEEQYLLDVSDKNARDSKTTLNFTGCPRIVMESWLLQIYIEVRYYYVKQFGIDHHICPVDFIAKSFGYRWGHLESAIRHRKPAYPVGFFQTY